MYSKELRINFFGNESNNKPKLNRINLLKKHINNFKIFLVIAGTNTSQIPGISAAGINAKSRRITALADAEFLLKGATKNHKYKCFPPGPSVSPHLPGCAGTGTDKTPDYRQLSGISFPVFYFVMDKML